MKYSSHYNKYSFIVEILNSKTITPSQKERILKLAANELKDENLKEVEILNRIEEIEKIMKQENLTPNKLEKSIKSKQHRPKETYNLLNRFSTSEGGIKNLTHSFNQDYIDYEKFISQCKIEFYQGINDFPDVPDKLFDRIREFAFSENPEWFIRKGNEKIIINKGWSEPEFVKWYKKNKKHPAIDASYNKEMIIPFKETIQVRPDFGNLPILINELKVLVFGENSFIDLSVNKTIDSASFYTDVDSVGQVFFNIFNTIMSFATINFCNKIEIDFYEENSMKYLSICHIDSLSPKNAKDKDFISGDINTIKTNLWGLCNYDIVAKFPDGCYRKVILSDNYNDLEKNKIDGKTIGKNYPVAETEVKGFTHLLKFY
jgi:hypothetical protein